MLLERAIEIAVDAHRGQKDKLGEPYILHPLRVMAQMNTDDARVVAVLHDVVEDCPRWMPLNIMNAGFGVGIIETLECLTRNKGEAYEDYIERCASNGVAKAVKLADLFDNLSTDRLCRLPYVTRKRLEMKYLPARYRLLNGAWPYEPGAETGGDANG